jgi:4-amino-4-deoxy-L-arabinose transferase-like glycosyltransferase
MPYMVWDESRLAVSAFEMLHNQNYWVVTYGNTPDLWSVKPPLMIWVIAFSFKLLGYNELGLRLPSALFGLATILVLYSFCKNYLKSALLAFLTIFVLITTSGYIDYHVTRTGDYDALLILCQMLFVFYFIRHHFQTVAPDLYSYKNLYWSAIFLSLALMTKGIAALFMCPSMLFFVIIERKFKLYAKNIHTYLAILVAFMPITLYFFWREHLSAGYWKAVWEMEFLSRYWHGDGDVVIANETLVEKIEYYLDSMYDTDFKPWLYLLPVGILSIFQHPNRANRKILGLFAWNAVFFMVLITFSNSKKPWYEAPVYPYLAVLVGSGLAGLWEQFKVFLSNNKHFVLKVSIGAMIILFLGIPYWRIFKKFHANTDHLHQWEKRQYSAFMTEIGKKMTFYVLQIDYNAAIEFTKLASNENNLFKTHSMLITDKQLYPKAVQIGDKIMYCEQSAQDSLDKYFTYKVIQTHRTCQLVEVMGSK